MLSLKPAASSFPNSHTQKIFLIFRRILFAVAAAYFCWCVSMRLAERGTSFAENECMVYYIVNADGMKGLGHSIVLLVGADGCGTVLSFNGMQRSLTESLMGKSGIGKMSVGNLSEEETGLFLQTGDLNLEEDQLQDNYDAALYRSITEEEYNIILEQTASYMAAEERFAALFEVWAGEENAAEKEAYEQELEQLGQDGSLPLYHIYRNNCDHAARLLISAVDPSMQDYVQHTRRMTPNGNMKAFAKKAESWGIIMLGEQSLWERILMFLIVF